MKISLVTSLHLNHGNMTPDHYSGAQIPLQDFVPVGLLSLKAYVDQEIQDTDIRVTEINGLINNNQTFAKMHQANPTSNGNGKIIANDDLFYEHIVNLILEPDDDMVGLMTDADSLCHTVIIAQIIKQRSPQTLICLGGPASSPMSRLILERFPFIDLIVRGEGEVTFVELICALKKGEEPASVLGLTWRRGDSIIENQVRRVVENLDMLPIPSFNAYNMDAGSPLYLDVGRGCPFKCHFCATAPFWSRKYRMKSIDRIIDEMTLVRDKYNRKQVNFSHDIFTCDQDWVATFCARLISERVEMKWTCSTRTDLITPDLLAKMAIAGCEEIYYGIESGSKEMQKQIHKNLDLNWSRKIVEATASVGIRPITGFIVGYPMETYQSLQDTLEKFFDFLYVGKIRAHLFTLTPFHESPMYRDYSNMINRPAEYYDLPTTPPVTALAEQIKTENQDIFSSTYRYKSPNLPDELIDASEEVSAHFVVLKSIWPHLLSKYNSALDLYTRWVEWIKIYNAEHRPGNHLYHQGDTNNLLQFVADEIQRLQLDDSPVKELLRYEQAKLYAQNLLPPSEKDFQRIDQTITAETIIDKNYDYHISPFEYDLNALLSGELEGLKKGSWWVIFAKRTGNEIDTIQIGEVSKRILDFVKTPVSVFDVIANLCGDSISNTDTDFQEKLYLIQQLVNLGLLVEVKLK